ncbi:MAG: carboxypeptidase regulatory-like domain-containing protein [Planctomycetes bacterium]|nr:carboxypeptidase regulatory-like domain-containing protein [Planctomycetota bacterium]
MQPIPLKAGTLRGIVKDYTGKPLAGTTLELVDTSGKTVAKTITNTRGEYLLADIPPGHFTMVVDGRTRLPLTMTTEASVSRLLIVPSVAAPGAPPPGAPAEGFLGLSTWTWVAIGGGAVVAVAIPLALGGGGGGGGGGGPVSP